MGWSQDLFIADKVTLPATTDGQSNFVTVQFNNTFDTAPVVVLTPSANNPDPAGIRIRNVTAEGFEVHMVEPPGSNGQGPAMGEVSFFAAEPGLYNIGGKAVQVGFVSTTETVSSAGGTGGFQNVSFDQTFSNAPIVIGMSQTMDGETNTPPGDPTTPWLTVTANNLTTTEMEIGFERAETGSGDLAVPERLGYIAIDSGTGSFTDNSSANILFDAFATADEIDGNLITVDYNQTFTDAPLVNANQRSRDGTDGSWAQIGTNTSTNVQLTVEEDLTSDTEQGHTTEILSVVAFSEAFVESLARKTTNEWSGAGGNDLSNAGANWNGWNGTNAALETGDALLFDDTGSARTTPNINVNYTTAVGKILFTEDTAYTLSGSGGFTLTDGASIVNDSSVTQTIGVNLTAQGSTLGLRADGGDLTLTSGADLDLSNSSVARLFVSGPDDISIAGVISGSGAEIIKTGDGVLTLSGNNTYGGLTDIRDGEVIVSTASLPGDVRNEAELTFNQTTTGTYSGEISGSGNLTVAGSDVLTLTGSNTFTGTTTLESGTLRLGSDAALGEAPISPTAGQFIFDGGTLSTANSLTLDANRGVEVAAGGGVISPNTGDTLTYNGVLAGTGDLEIDGIGQVVLGGSSANTLSGELTVTDGTLQLQKTPGVNALSGVISLDGGTLELGANNQLGDSSTLNFNGGVFDLRGFSEGDESNAGIGQLNLLADSILRFSDNSSFRFDTETFIAGELGIEGWVGDPNNGSDPASANRFLVNSDLTGDPFLDQIIFSDWNNASAKVIDIDMDGIFEIVPDVTVYQWDQDASGDWNDSTKWSGGPTFPDATGEFAQLIDITADRTITLTADRTIGSLDIIEDVNDYTITGNTLTFELDLTGSNSARLGLGGGGSHTIESNLVLNSDLTINQNGTSGSEMTLSGVIADGTNGDSLIKRGVGQLTLTGANTYTGLTAVEGGTLAISSDNNLGATPGSPTASSIVLDGGTLQADATMTLNANRGIELGLNNGAVNVTTANTMTYNGIVAGSGGLEKTGSGTLILGGSNTFAGATAIREGTLQISADNGLGAAPGFSSAEHLVFDGGTLQATDTFTIASNRGLSLEAGGGTIAVSSGEKVTADSIISGLGNLTISGPGTLDLNRTNTYTGTTTVNSGATINLSSDANLGTAPASPTAGHLTLDDATIGLDSTLSLNTNRGITLGAGGATIDAISGRSLTINGSVSGSGSLTKTGSGNLTLNNAKNYSGGTVIEQGTVFIGNNAALGTGNVTIDGSSSLRSNASNLTVANDITLNNNLTIGGTDFTLNGDISGTGALTKNTTGRVTLGGDNTFTGGVTHSNSILRLDSNTALGTGTLQINSSATALEFSSNATSITNNIALSTNVSLDTAGSTTLSGTLSGSNNITKTGAGQLTLSADNTYTGTTNITNGTLRVGTGGTTGTLGSGAVTGSGNGKLLIDRSDTYTFGQSINVPELEIASGTLSVSNDITASSAYTMASGTKLDVTGDLTLDLSDVGSGQIDIADDAAIEVGAGDTLTIEVSNGLPTLTSQTVYHDFNNNTGVIGNDDSGNNFNSTDVLGSAPTFDTANVIAGTSSAAFNGSQGLSFANGNQLITNDSESVLSVATWFRPTTTGTNMIFEEGGGTNGLQLWTTGTTLNAGIRNNGGNPQVTFAIPGAVTTNEWSHAAFTYDSGDVRLYLDGALVGQGTFDTSLNTHGSDGGIGNHDGGPFLNGSFTGNLDEFYYFNDLALSGGQIDGFGDFGLVEMGDLTLNSGSTATVNNTGTEVAFNSVTANGDSTLNGSTTLQLSTIDVTSGSTLNVESNLSGNNALNKNGNGTLVLSGTNDFTGALNVNTGQITVTGSLYNNVNGGDIVIASGGTLLLDDASVFDNALSTSEISLGGTLQIGAGADGASFDFGTLTLTDDSVIDFAGSDAILDFAALDLGGNSLQIWNYNGNAYTGNGSEQLIFGNDLGLVSSDQIAFFNGSPGDQIGGFSRSLPSGEVVPVPETGTWLSGGALLLLAAGHHRMQRRKRKAIAG